MFSIKGLHIKIKCLNQCKTPKGKKSSKQKRKTNIPSLPLFMNMRGHFKEHGGSTN